MPESPIGSIAAYAGPIDAAFESANGWMLCDGRSLNRTDPSFSPLFNQIGSSWGGDGVNAFNIPDLRGLFLRGVDVGAGAAGWNPPTAFYEWRATRPEERARSRSTRRYIQAG
jgi:microcystin-dependent protein